MNSLKWWVWCIGMLCMNIAICEAFVLMIEEYYKKEGKENMKNVKIMILAIVVMLALSTIGCTKKEDLTYLQNKHQEYMDIHGKMIEKRGEIQKFIDINGEVDNWNDETNIEYMRLGEELGELGRTKKELAAEYNSKAKEIKEATLKKNGLSVMLGNE